MAVAILSGAGLFVKAVSFAEGFVLGTVGPALPQARVVMVNGVGGDGKILVMVSTVAIVEVARGVHARIVAVVVTLPAMVASRSACLGFTSPMSISSGWWFGTSDSMSNAEMIRSGSTGPGSNYAHGHVCEINGRVVMFLTSDTISRVMHRSSSSRV